MRLRHNIGAIKSAALLQVYHCSYLTFILRRSFYIFFLLSSTTSNLDATHSRGESTITKSWWDLSLQPWGTYHSSSTIWAIATDSSSVLSKTQTFKATKSKFNNALMSLSVIHKRHPLRLRRMWKQLNYDYFYDAFVHE